MQTNRIYQVQHWPNGQWDRRHNWQKIEAESEKEAAEKVCGFALTQTGRLAQLRARVLRLGDLRQRSATDFYSVESVTLGGGGSSSALGSMLVPAAARTRASLWLGPGFVTSTTPGGNSTGLTFFMSRARIRALARIPSIDVCWCRKLAASLSGGFFAVAM